MPLIQLPINDRSDVLPHSRRRCVLRYLQARDTPLSLADPTHEYLSLNHHQIPKVVAYDLVQYSQKQDTVEPTDHGQTLDPESLITEGVEE